MDNEKSILIKEEQTNQMCPEPTTMFREHPLGFSWSTDHINEDSRPNLGWDENENNNAVVNTLLHTIMEAESECCPPPLLVSKEEPFPDDTLGISCLSDFIKEDPELNLEADVTENISLQEPLKLEEPILYVKHEVELILDVDDPEQKVQVYPSSVNEKEEMEDALNQEVQVYPSSTNVKEEMEDGVNQEYPEDPLRFEAPGLHIKQDPELDLDVDGPEHNFMEDPLGISWTTDYLKEGPALNLEAEDTANIVAASACLGSSSKTREGSSRWMQQTLMYPTSSKRLLENESCHISIEETVNQGLVHSELELHPKKSMHFPMISGAEEGGGDQGDSVMEQSEKPCSSMEASKTLWTSFNDTCNTTINDNADIVDIYDKGGTSYTTGNINAHNGLLPLKRPQKCDICGISFSLLDVLKTHTLIHSRINPHKCDICGKSFSQLGSLKRHALIHSRITPHKCDVCGKFFSDLCNLKRHGIIHTGMKPYKCVICGKYFSYLGDLKRHGVIHIGMKPYKCVICGISFSLLGDLETHAFIQCGTKPHKCGICRISFSQLGSLKNHILMHSGAAAHKCDICGKYFSQLGGLKTHTLIHSTTTPHKCDICGVSFSYLGSLKRHALIHSGIKPHKCDICGKSFSQLCNLKTHILIHSGIKPHKCGICGKYFRLLGDLKRHKLIHYGTILRK